MSPKRRNEPFPDLFRLVDLRQNAWFQAGVKATDGRYEFHLRRGYRQAALIRDDEYWQAITALAGLCSHFGVPPSTVLKHLWEEAIKLDRRVRPKDLLSIRTRRLVEQVAAKHREDPSKLIDYEMSSFHRQFQVRLSLGDSEQAAVKAIVVKGDTNTDIVYVLATLMGDNDLARRCEPFALWCWKLEPLRGKCLRESLEAFRLNKSC